MLFFFVRVCVRVCKELDHQNYIVNGSTFPRRLFSFSLRSFLNLCVCCTRCALEARTVPAVWAAAARLNSLHSIFVLWLKNKDDIYVGLGVRCSAMGAK